MTLTAITVTVARIDSWIHTDRGSRTMSVRSPAVGRDQRVARGVRAWHLTDRATPLHLEFGEVALPSRSREQSGVQPAQGQIDHQGDVGEVTPEPVGHGAFDPRVGRQ